MISSQRRPNPAGARFLDKLSVAQRQDSIAKSRCKIVVRHQQDSSVVFPMQIIEGAKNFFSGAGIEVAGGFIA
jgi:hypothetical protein